MIFKINQTFAENSQEDKLGFMGVKCDDFERRKYTNVAICFLFAVVRSMISDKLETKQKHKNTYVLKDNQVIN